METTWRNLLQWAHLLLLQLPHRVPHKQAMPFQYLLPVGRSLGSLLAISLLLTSSLYSREPIRVLIVDGANNHDWQITTDAIRATLNSTGQFAVEVATAPQSTMYKSVRVDQKADEATKQQFADFVVKHSAPSRTKLEQGLNQQWEDWNPNFSKYDTVLLNYNGRSWSKAMQTSLVTFVRDGGGLVLIHAANNGFRDWTEFNEMIGLGYNGSRGTKEGECTKIDPKTGKRYLCCVGKNSGHGSKHPFVVQVRAPNHPIMQGIPLAWRHGTDELYHNLRGPAKNITVLSSAFSDIKQRGTGHHEPITWTVTYGKGRVVETTMGHFWPNQNNWDSLYCVGFQTVIARSCQFTATGKVTLDLPASFPKNGQTSIKRPHTIAWTIAGKPATPKKKDKTDWRARIEKNPYVMLTPEEQRESFVLADGFVAELVASEPMIQEPVLAVWDADGAMYVAEMNSYMQDEIGTGTKTLNNGRIKKLVDLDGDGVMDKATIFADNLNLPRMILPLDDRIAVVETDNTTVWSYTDTNHDGVADKKELLFQGRVDKDRKRSVEHQESGLIWNLDNWIYVSYNNQRYRFTDGTWKSESAMGLWSQWGLSHDDTGRIYYSSNDRPIVAQVPQKYWRHIKRATGGDPRFVPTVGFPFEHDYLISKQLCKVGDKGPGSSPTAQFTSLCGQEIYRGNAFPSSVRGDLFFADPTIHVVRRSKVNNVNGKIVLTNADGDGEFLLSSDFNFRPVNTHTGPDGCLYVVDMHRGIIQDAPWFNEQSQAYARETGFSKHIKHGRIWRIRHKNHQPTKIPKMLDEPTLALLRHFQSSNGWVRDTAQKLIVLRGNSKTISPEDRQTLLATLGGLVRHNRDWPLVRLHALWTLDGLNATDQSLVEFSLGDRDPRIRSAAIEIGEPFIQQEKASFYDALDKVADDRDPEVAKQLIMSLGWSRSQRATKLIEQAARNHIGHDGIFLAVMASSWKNETDLIKSVRDGTAFTTIKDDEARTQQIGLWTAGLATWEHKRTQFPAEWTSKQRWLAGGENIFFQACSRCHGPNGKGQKLPGHDLLLAPPLVGSPRVLGDPENMIRILVHGLTGPVNGQTYGAGVMPKIEALGHDNPNRIAQVANYVRYAWGNGQMPVDVSVVQKVISETKDREQAYTLRELGLDSGGFSNKALEKELLAAPVSTLAEVAMENGDAERGKQIFYNSTVACFSCHDPPAGAVRLGPDLKQLKTDITTAQLVDSILRPSNKIDKTFAQATVLTNNGKVITGLRVSESEKEVVLRSTADSKLIRISRSDIDEISDSKVSPMPVGLVTQLKDRQQFDDLVKYLGGLRK